MLDASSALTLKALSADLRDDLVRIRRYLHRYPEVSESEYKTTEFLALQVRALNCKPTLAGDDRGLFVDFGQADRRIVIRGDIDALPIATDLQTEYASCHSGVMHACGHDAHAAMVWGALAILVRLEQSNQLPFPVGVRVVFQPAEETSSGGPHMIAAGALEGIDAAIALHVDPTRARGTVGVRFGSFTAGCDTFRVRVEGQAGHGARPHLTGDALAAAAAWINQVYVRVPRCHDPHETIVVNVGQFNAGTAANIVPAWAELSGTLRATTWPARNAAIAAIENVSRSIELTHRSTVIWQLSQRTPAVINNPIVSAAMQRASVDVLGGAHVETIGQPSMGAEDFSFFAEQVPSAMIRLGVAGDGIGQMPLHSPQFDIDEDALAIGAMILADAAIKLCDPDLTLPTRKQTDP